MPSIIPSDNLWWEKATQKEAKKRSGVLAAGPGDLAGSEEDDHRVAA